MKYRIAINPEILHSFTSDLFSEILHVNGQINVTFFTLVDGISQPPLVGLGSVVPSWAVALNK